VKHSFFPLRAEHKLQVSEEKVQGKIFGINKEEVSQKFILYYEEVCELHITVYC
jgi:hypothetical protein